jgi:phosphohistidine phosphatase SixA
MMGSRQILRLIRLMMVFFPFAWGAAAALDRPAVDDVEDRARMTSEAVTALREGGYVVVMSHGPAASEELDFDNRALDSCANQRSLTDTGRLMASGIGKLLAREKVRIGVIVSSRYCRGLETAERIAEHTRTGKLRGLDELNDVVGTAAATDMPRRAEALRRLTGAAPAAGTNTIVVTHRANIAAAFGDAFAGVGDGELAVFRPIGREGPRPYQLAYRLRIEDLSKYAGTRKRDVRAPGP